MSDHLALIYNPFSRKNLKNGPDYLKAIQALPNILFYAPDTHDALQSVVEDLCARKPACIVVDGGDGTVGKVLSALYASTWPVEEWPPVAVFPSGNTNLIAADVGYGKRGAEALRFLQAELCSGQAMLKLKQRCPLIVQRNGHEGAAVLGFFGGMGAFGRGISIAHQPAVLNRYAHDMAVVATLAMTVMQLLRPRQRAGWLAGAFARLTYDGQVSRVRNHFMVLCTALNTLPYGVWPFWRAGGATVRGMHYLDVAAYPPSLMRAVWTLLRGRAPEWLRRTPAYQSGSVQILKIQTTDSFVLDGEILEPGEEEDFTILAGPVVSFLYA
ncbi:MAG: acylglycerol kinase family protein [Acetobacter syzygii]|uniref:diacylglycerol/lipid kinase family protein n=1 Tax=Acetobacter syzygii TaxID=146476 RepID=UPI0039ED3A1A